MIHFIAVSEVICFSISFLCNYLGLSALKNEKAYLLVPWLGFYLLGFISCYLATLYLFTTNLENKISPEFLLPLTIGNH